MKNLYSKVQQLLFGTRFAKSSDILGNKSGGVRDSNKVDWRASNGAFN